MSKHIGFHFRLILPNVRKMQAHVLNVSVVFSVDGMKLPVNQRQRVGSNGTLTITSVERASDGGTYTCSAWDSQGRTARRDIQVNVVGKT